MPQAILCDIGGHDTVLETILHSLGADIDSGYLPTGLSIVQVCDLVRLSPKRGAGSDRCVEIADKFINTGRWTQIIGNHEVACIGGSAMATWDAPSDCLSTATLDTLARWWETGLMQVATVVPFEDAPTLVTHAGLTSAQHRALGSPTTPSEAARSLNQVIGLHPKDWDIPGVLVTGVVSPDADCLWADSASELYPSWELRPMPFNQIHGHSQVFDWVLNDWKGGASDSVRHMSVVDSTRRTVRFRTSGHTLLGIDWTLTDVASVPATLPPAIMGDV